MVYITVCQCADVDSSRGNNRPPENTQCVTCAFAETRSRPSHVLALIPTTRWAFDWSDPTFYSISRADVIKVAESYANTSLNDRPRLRRCSQRIYTKFIFFPDESSIKLRKKKELKTLEKYFARRVTIVLHMPYFCRAATHTKSGKGHV